MTRAMRGGASATRRAMRGGAPASRRGGAAEMKEERKEMHHQVGHALDGPKRNPGCRNTQILPKDVIKRL